MVPALTGCNGDSDSGSYGETDLTTSTMVTSFTLGANRKIMADLDSVFFSIDLVNRNIYNADSLPYGTDVSRLLVKISTPNDAKLEMQMSSRYNGSDTTINLTEHPNDTINFASRINTLVVTAPDGTTVTTYNVKVNVHKVLPDSLSWSATDRGQLPTTIPSPDAVKAVKFGDKLICLAGTPRRTTLSVTTDPFDFSDWTSTDVTLPDGADINTFCATSDALYIVCADGSLHTASDLSLAWTEAEPAGSGWTHLYGGFGDLAVGVRGSEWATYPSAASGPIASLGADFPVKQTSQLITYTSDWDVTPQALMAGGITASGATSGATWAFDGTSWFRLSNPDGLRALPPAEGYTIFPYFTFLSGAGATVTKRATWIAIGYEKPDRTGTGTSKVYTSLDNGISWLPAPKNLQLPADFGARYCAQAIVWPHTITASRIIKPITEWDADYIYLFGGRYLDSYDLNIKVRNQLWRGVIQRLTFKPLY